MQAPFPLISRASPAQLRQGLGEGLKPTRLCPHGSASLGWQSHGHLGMLVGPESRELRRKPDLPLTLAAADDLRAQREGPVRDSMGAGAPSSPLPLAPADLHDRRPGHAWQWAGDKG